ncbi:MAG: N-acetylmuramoyl-L-alanine amidase-like domain-containing protein [Smithella sp.]
MKVNQYEDYSYGNLVAAIARLFIHKPYKTGMLEQPGKERLMVDLSAFDCTTFVETVLALARCADSGKISSHAFRKQLKSIRYRQGKINGYASRLHYFSDWLRDNEKMNFVADISKNLGGKPHRKKINFMTAHQALYPALNNKAQWDRMLTIEKNLSRRVLHIVDQDTVNTQATKIKNGDIIAFATHQEGLDVAHVGFAVREGKSLRLLHASKKEGRVVISKKTIVSYLKSNKNFTGIIIAESIGCF